MSKALILCALLLTPLAATWAGEADVLEADVTCNGDSCRFSVTVEHADEGWDHYADKWEILGPDGGVIAVRELAHPHETEQPFTRSLVHPATNIAPFSGPQCAATSSPARGCTVAERCWHGALRVADRPAGAPLSRHGCVVLLVKDRAIHCGARLPLTAQEHSECHNISGGVH